MYQRIHLNIILIYQFINICKFMQKKKKRIKKKILLIQKIFIQYCYFSSPYSSCLVMSQKPFLFNYRFIYLSPSCFTIYINSFPREYALSAILISADCFSTLIINEASFGINVFPSKILSIFGFKRGPMFGSL